MFIHKLTLSHVAGCRLSTRGSCSVMRHVCCYYYYLYKCSFLYVFVILILPLPSVCQSKIIQMWKYCLWWWEFFHILTKGNFEQCQWRSVLCRFTASWITGCDANTDEYTSHTTYVELTCKYFKSHLLIFTPTVLRHQWTVSWSSPNLTGIFPVPAQVSVSMK